MNEGITKRETYLRVLELEAICLAVRCITYPKGSKPYYEGKIKEKMKKISEIAQYEDIYCILNDDAWAEECIKNIIPKEKQYPNFVYNHHLKKMPDPKYLYPNSLIQYESEEGGEREVCKGVCESVSLTQNSVRMIVQKEGSSVVMAFPLNSCKRLDYQESDKYFWELWISKDISIKKELLSLLSQYN